MKLRRSLVLVAASVAALTMGGEAMASPAAPGDAEPNGRYGVDLDLPTGEMRAAEEGSLFTPTSPVRVLDTRATGAVPARGSVTLDLSGRVPEGTTAVVLNVTGVAPTVASFVTVWPAEKARPAVSNLNLAAGEIRANGATVGLGPSRQLKLYNNSGTINLVADLAGYYSMEGEAFYNSHSPIRVLDTRFNGGPIPGGSTITVDTSSVLASASARAVTVNLTVVNPTVNTFLTAFPSGTARPNASSINVNRGTITANQVTVTLGADQDLRLYNNSGSANVIVDVLGFYDLKFGDKFFPVDTERIFDSRSDAVALPGGARFQIFFAEDPDDPNAQISSMVLNVTGTGGTAATFLTVFPSGTSRPNASTVNLAKGQTAANGATTALGWDSDEFGPFYGFDVYNNSGSVHVIVDLAGVFIPSTIS